MRLLTLIFLIGSNAAFKLDDCDQKPEALNQIRRVGPKAYAYNLDFFYQKALSYNAIHSFTDVFLQINLTNSDQYQIYQGSNCSSVQQLYDNDNRYFGLLRKAALLRSYHLNPFSDTIIGVSTAEPYEISVLIWEVSYIRVGIYVGAVVLFLLASKLVRNAVFYYTSGCSLGIIASILLVAFLVWRVAPKKTIGVPILIGGWSVSLYMLHFAWTNFQSIMLEYQKYVIGYFAAVLLISMAVCYKRGPPTDARSHDIAQWTLQLIALVLIYFSVQMVEVSFGTIFALILQQICRGFLFSGVCWYFSGLGTLWRRYFPKKRQLLNEEEYDDIGRRTTREQLDQLKEYCKKEGNHPWKIAGNVRSARRNRLARFIEGEDDHVTDDEIYAHELTGDILDREDYEEDLHYSHIHRSVRNGAHESIEEDEQDENEDEQEWDDIVVRRRDTFSGGGTVQSIRVPRSVSSRLLSPYENRMNRSLGPGVGYRRPDPVPIDNGFYSDQRRQAPRTEYIRRSRRVEYDATRNRIKPLKTSQASQAPRLRNTQSSSAAMTPSEYMRRVRNVDGPSRTPTRRNRETNSHDHSDSEEGE